MFPCEADLNLYTAKRLPKWAQAMREEKAKSRASVALIDMVVNAHGNVRATSGECAAQNTMWFAAGQIRRGAPWHAVAAYLEQIAGEYDKQARQPGRAEIGDRRRASFARKWAKRLRESQ